MHKYLVRNLWVIVGGQKGEAAIGIFGKRVGRERRGTSKSGKWERTCRLRYSSWSRDTSLYPRSIRPVKTLLFQLSLANAAFRAVSREPPATWTTARASTCVVLCRMSFSTNFLLNTVAKGFRIFSRSSILDPRIVFRRRKWKQEILVSVHGHCASAEFVNLAEINGSLNQVSVKLCVFMYNDYEGLIVSRKLRRLNLLFILNFGLLLWYIIFVWVHFNRDLNFFLISLANFRHAHFTDFYTCLLHFWKYLILIFWWILRKTEFNLNIDG